MALSTRPAPAGDAALWQVQLQQAIDLVERFNVPVPVAEYLVALAEDYADAGHFRIARMGDDVALKRYNRIEKEGAQQKGRTAVAERFYWDSVGYLIGFTHRASGHR